MQSRLKQVAAAVRTIKAFHALGRSLPKKQKHEDAYDQGTIDAAARKLGINPDTVRKARQFADPVVGYTVAEMDELCRRIVAVQAGQDHALAVFSRSHLIRMLSVGKRHRTKLVERALRNAWSTAMLEAEIAARYGSRKNGGRKRRVPADAVGLLVQIEAMCESWRRLLVAFDPRESNVPASHPVLENLPEAVKRRTREAARALDALHRVVTDELRKQHPRREARRALRDDDE